MLAAMARWSGHKTLRNQDGFAATGINSSHVVMRKACRGAAVGEPLVSAMDVVMLPQCEPQRHCQADVDQQPATRTNAGEACRYSARDEWIESSRGISICRGRERVREREESRERGTEREREKGGYGEGGNKEQQEKAGEGSAEVEAWMAGLLSLTRCFVTVLFRRCTGATESPATDTSLVSVAGDSDAPCTAGRRRTPAAAENKRARR